MTQDGRQWDVGYLLEHLITHPIHHIIMNDIDAKFRKDNDAVFHMALNPLMHDLGMAYEPHPRERRSIATNHSFTSKVGRPATAGSASASAVNRRRFRLALEGPKRYPVSAPGDGMRLRALACPRELRICSLHPLHQRFCNLRPPTNTTVLEGSVDLRTGSHHKHSRTANAEHREVNEVRPLVDRHDVSVLRQECLAELSYAFGVRCQHRNRTAFSRNV